MITNKLRKKGSIWLTLSHCGPLLEGVRTGQEPRGEEVM